MPLLRQDLLHQLGAQINFENGKVQVHLPKANAWQAQIYLLQKAKKRNLKMCQKTWKMQLHALYRQLQKMWKSEKYWTGKNWIKIGSSASEKETTPYQQGSQKKKKGLEPILSNFLKYLLLSECHSEYNTPILLVKKPHNRQKRLVQDLTAVKKLVMDIHPVVPNSYTLLAIIRESNEYFSLFHLKEAFFCIPLEENSKNIFAFEWEDPSPR